VWGKQKKKKSTEEKTMSKIDELATPERLSFRNQLIQAATRR